MSNSKENGIKVTSWPIIQKWVEASRTNAIEETKRRRRINAMLAERHRKHQEQLTQRKLRRAASPTLLCHLIGTIRWRKHRKALIRGKLAPLPRRFAHQISEAAEWTGLKPLSAELHVSPMHIVIGLLALADADADPAARSVARAIFKSIDPDTIGAAAVAMGLRLPAGDKSD